MKYLEKSKVLGASTMKCKMALSFVLVPGYALAEDDIVTLIRTPFGEADL